MSLEEKPGVRGIKIEILSPDELAPFDSPKRLKAFEMAEKYPELKLVVELMDILHSNPIGGMAAELTDKGEFYTIYDGRKFNKSGAASMLEKVLQDSAGLVQEFEECGSEGLVSQLGFGWQLGPGSIRKSLDQYRQAEREFQEKVRNN
jgi:hypothetical protein